MPRASRYPSLGELDTLDAGSALLAVFLTLFARLHPTSLGWWDTALSVGFGLLVATAGSRSGRNSAYWMTGVASVAAMVSNPFWAIPGLVGIGLTAWSPSNRRRNPLRSLAAVGALGSLVNIDSLTSWAVPSVVTAIAFLPVLVSAYRRSGPHQRQNARVALGVAGFLTVLVTGSAVIAGGQAYSHLATAQSALTKARQGFRVTELDTSIETSRTQLKDAEEELRHASEIATGPFGRIGRFAPVASQHLMALDRTATNTQRAIQAGVGLLDAASGATDSTSLLDAERMRAIAAAAAQAEPVLVNTSSQLRNTSRDWLVPQASDALDEATDLSRRAAVAVTTTSDLGMTLPSLLGFEGPTRYLVLFATPAESRELGGFVGAYGIVEFDTGTPTLVAAGDNELMGLESARLGRSLPTNEFSPWYRDYDPATYPQNVTGSVDFNVVADASLTLFDGLDGSSLDGVIYADPFALEAIVALGPPVELTDAAGQPLRLDGTSTAEFLLRGQYRAFPRASDRTVALVEVFKQSFDGIGASLKNRPIDVVNALAPIVDQGRLQIAPADSQARDILAKYGVVRTLPVAGGTDFISVVQTNATTSKLDAYLTRDVQYVVQFDPATGAVQAEVTVTIASSATDSLPVYVYGASDPDRDRKPSTDSVLLSVFTPHELNAITIDDQPVNNFRTFPDAGYQRHMVQVDIPAQQRVVVRYQLSGSVTRGNYALSVGSQPLSAPDNWSIELNPAANWRIETAPDGTSPHFAGPLTQNLALLWILSS